MSALSKKHSFNEVFDGQSVFRKILEALSNPARVVSIKRYADKLFGENPALLALSLTLLDNEVSFCTYGNCGLSEDILTLTLSKREQVTSADFIFVSNINDLKDAVWQAKYGSLADPHKSATVIVQNDGDMSCEMTLYGPGIDDKITVCVSELVRTALETRDEQYYEYPQGIDFIFVTCSGDLSAFPRLIRWKVR